MKFSFNEITPDAREVMQSLGIRHERIDNMWQVWTEEVDSKIEEILNKSSMYNTDVVMEALFKKEQQAQSTRIWKNPESGVYSYLWKDTVFYMFKRLTTLWKTNVSSGERYPTTFETSILDVVDKEFQEDARHALIILAPNANPEEGGVLL